MPLYFHYAVYTVRLGRAKEPGERKQASKHGVTFEEARTAFFDADARVIHDPDHSGDEDRFILVGMSRRVRVLTVCHCFREQDEVIRIISARRATRREQDEYSSARR